MIKTPQMVAQRGALYYTKNCLTEGLLPVTQGYRGVLETFAQLGQGVAQDLANPAFGEVQSFADLLQSETLIEIESRDDPLLLV